MLYREVLLELGDVARMYLSELSHRQRSRLDDEVLEVYALYERCGGAELLAAMELADAQGAYGAAYLRTLVSAPVAEPARQVIELTLAGVPHQTEVDRELSTYEVYVWWYDSTHGVNDLAALVTAGGDA